MINKENYKNVEVAGITYSRPSVYLLQESGLGVAEFAGRTAYNSFDKSENMAIKAYNESVELNESQMMVSTYAENLNSIKSSNLLDQLAHVYHHDSVLEHINLQYLIKGTSRGVLQEHARHRIQSITVQSTRYTMSPIINAFIACMNTYNKDVFTLYLKDMDFLVVDGIAEHIEMSQIWDKLWHQAGKLNSEFYELALSKSSYEWYMKNSDSTIHEIFTYLQAGKQKRNVGDSFKWIVTDNWKVDLVFTMNLRSLKNYLKLRDSGAAYFQIQWLAEEVITVTPQKYLDLISKKYNKD